MQVVFFSPRHTCKCTAVSPFNESMGELLVGEYDIEKCEILNINEWLPKLLFNYVMWCIYGRCIFKKGRLLYFVGENSIFFVADEAITDANYTQV